MQQESFVESELPQLIVQAQHHDDAAFCRIYDYFLPKIYGFIYKRVGDQDMAEDLTSQTFLKMVEALPRFKGDFFKSWIYRIASNVVIDHYRVHREHTPIEEAYDLKTANPGPVEEASHGEDRLQIERALQTLSEKYRHVLQLKFFGDLSNEEIAASLQITTNNAGVLIHRALEQFERAYRRTEIS